jgi:nucleotide-binding universal stress UspA family protein
MFKTILVPLDGSAESKVALPLARALAEATRGSIWLLRVASDPDWADDHSGLQNAGAPLILARPGGRRVTQAYAAPSDAGGAGFFDSAWDDDALTAAKTYVAAVGQRLRKLARAVEGEALTGPARAILASVADAVVRTSPCPVVVVKRKEEVPAC